MENKKITVSPKEQMNEMLTCFRMMELVAQSPEEFDPTENLNEKDQEYPILVAYYNASTGSFDYKKFLADQLTKIGTGFQNVLIGYEELFDRYCEPGIGILKQKENLVSIDSDHYLVRGKVIAEYDSLPRYKTGVSQLISSYSGERVSISFIDKNGCSVTAADLYNNPSGDFYPVKAYSNLSALDFTVAHKSISNN